MTTPETTEGKYSGRRIVLLLLAMQLCGFAAAILYHYVFAGFYLDLAWPASSLGEKAGFFANDLTRLLAVARDFDPYSVLRIHVPHEAAPYGPLAFVLYGVLAGLPYGLGKAVFYAAGLAGMAYAAWRIAQPLGRGVRPLAAAVVLLASFPVLYVLDRGNLDMLIMPLVLCGFIAVQDRQDMTRAAVLFAIAGALKLYPVVFLVLFVMNREWRALAVAIGTGLGLTLLSSVVLAGGPVAVIEGLLGEIALTSHCFTSMRACTGLSLAIPFKIAFGFLDSAELAAGYAVAAPLILLLGVWLLWRLRPSMDQAATILVSNAVLLPVMSFHYKLLLFLIPLVFLMRRAGDRDALASIALIMALMVPKKMLGLHAAYLVDIGIILALDLVTWLAIAGRTRLFETLSPARIAGVAAIGLVALVAVYGMSGLRLAKLPLFVRAGTIEFSEADWRGFYGSGWGPFESDAHNTWRWMHGHSARLTIRITPDRDWRIRAVMSNHAGNEGQVVQLLLDGVALGEIAIPAGSVSEPEFLVPSEVISPTALNRHTVEVRALRANPPPGSGETRLGVSLTRMEFRVAEH